jgi:formylglycine-generating enzyme required for sulfatase activity
VSARSWSVVALFLAAPLAAAESPRPIAWRLREKDQFYVQWSFLQQTTSHLNQLHSETMEDGRAVLHFRVLKRKPNGSVELEMQVRSVAARAVGKAVPPLPVRLEGAVVRLTLDEDMALQRVDGLDDVLVRLAGPATAETEPLRAQVEQHLRYWVDNIFYPLPGKALAGGQTWEASRRTPLAGIGSEKRQMTFTVAGEETIDGRRLRKVPFTTLSRFLHDEPEDPGILNRRPRPEVTFQKQGGTLYYDAVAGRVARAQTDDYIKGEGSGRLRGEPVDLTVEVHLATTLRLTDYDPLAAVTRKPAARSAQGAAEPQELTASIPRKMANSLGMKMVLVPAGKFTMGSPAGQANRTAWEDERAIEITRPFYMGAHEVTIGQFARFVAATGYQTTAEKNGKGAFGYDKETGKLEPKTRFSWRNPGWKVTDDHPVVNLSWDDCKAFCEWLSKKEGKKYRLPTEAEWEYACRAGTRTRYHGGDDPETLVDVGNVVDASAKKLFAQWQAIEADDGFAFTAPVGSFAPNDLGLFDMHGNAMEWCEDWLWYYNPDECTDPHGPPFGCLRVQRGGSWADFPYQCTSSRRTGLPPDAYCVGSGFRVVMPAGDKDGR